MKTPKKRATPKKRGPGLPDIQPGTTIEIAGLDDPFGGLSFVTPTTHTIGDGGYATRFEAAPVKKKAPKKPKPGKKRGRGRPRLPASQKAAPLSVYLTPPERANLRALVKAERERTGAHVTASDVVRAMLRRKRTRE